MSVGTTFTGKPVISSEPFPGLPALAERLGVKPDDGVNGVWLRMNDGTCYNLIALVNAMLDRMDAVTLKSNK